MSWPTWHSTAPPLPGVIPTPAIQSTVLPSAVNPAPSLLPPPAVAAIPAGMQYSPEQWAQMQQQNWQQWAQWQQQYQQWHQQYGAEYQKSMNALSASTASTAAPPPPPTENKPPPPPPPDDSLKGGQYNTAQPRSSSGYSTIPPPSQQYLSGPPPTIYSGPAQSDWQNPTNKRSLSQNEEFEGSKRQMKENPNQWSKQSQPPKSGNSWQTQPPPNTQSQAQKVLNLEELTEAEKKFDKEFAAWEAQFNKWKEQNANHPDKTQYLEYEKKWESWRNSLLDRREQMRKKRTALQSSMSVSTPKAAVVPTQQFFKQPPPLLPQVYSSQKDEIASDMFTKPPPTQNNEPLSFKQPTSYSDENRQDECSEIGNDFLKSSSPAPGGIPGLDLVKGGTAQGNADDEHTEARDISDPISSKGPDLDAISKGINSILGDPKLLNMLSMVSQNQKFSVGISVDTQSKIPDAPQQAQRIGGPIPSLLDMPLQRPTLEKSNQSYDEYPEAYSSSRLETVNNFDDQTRMSFSNGPNEQELGYANNSVNSSRPDKMNGFRRFAGADNRHMFSGNPNSDYKFGNPNIDYKFGRNNGFEGPSDIRPASNQPDHFVNTKGPGFMRGRETKTNFNFSNTYGRVSDDNYENHNQYDEDGNNEQWNEEDEYEKYHNLFNEGDHSEEVPTENAHPMSTQVESPMAEEPLFVPQVVVDYEHKSLKFPEPEVSLDVIRTFDYRHKPVNRIPYPQRPTWLSSSLRNIKQFDPLGTGRFSSIDRGSHFEREQTRYPSERNDQFDRRSNFVDRDVRSNDDYHTYSRDRYSENRNNWTPHIDRDLDCEKEKTRYDYSPIRSRDTNFRQVSGGVSRNRYTEERIDSTQALKKNLGLEELSDDEWPDDDKNVTSGDNIKFSPPSRSTGRRSPHISLVSKSANPVTSPLNQNTTLDDLINPPGRYNRPSRIVIILRGPPGSGKTHLAKLIKDKEVENGGSAPRILSLDDYFMVEHEKEVIEDGKAVRIKEMSYEYEADMEESYRQSLTKAFKKTIIDGYFHFVVVDNVNQKVKNFGEMWSFAKQNGFQVYICQLDLDPELCTRRNIHHRSESYIEDCIAGWEPTPGHHPLVDSTGFLQSVGSIMEVEMEEVDQLPMNKDDADQPGSMVSANPSDRPGQWKNTSSWTMNGKNLMSPQNQPRKGFDGPTWRNRNNRGR